MVIKDTYEKAGITYSVKKSYWEPRYIIEHIGFIWDFTENVIRITPKRLRKVKIAYFHLPRLLEHVGFIWDFTDNVIILITLSVKSHMNPICSNKRKMTVDSGPS